MNGESILISEIFGPTIQGEGQLIGRPTVFVRTGGCDYRCTWCDTRFAVDNTFRPEWTAMTAGEIMVAIERLAGHRPLLVSLSGGNPALQPLGDLLALGRQAGYPFALETQGSVAKPWFAELDFLTLSPKPPSSGMTVDRRTLKACIAAAGNASISLKFVVASEADYLFGRQVAAWFPQLPVSLQPCNPCNEGPQDDGLKQGDPANMYDRLRWLVERTISDGWYEARILPQLHLLLWGNKRGV